MTEPAMQISVGVDLDSVDRDFKKVVQKMGMVPRKVSVGIEAVGTDETVNKIEKTRSATERMNAQIQRQVAVQTLAMRAVQDYERTIARAGAANDNYERSNSHLVDAMRMATKAAIEHTASYVAHKAAVAATMLVIGGVVGILGTLYLAYKAIKAGIDLVSEAWELGGEKLEEYRKIAEKAAASDLSTDYFQRITKAATEARLPIDDLTAAFKKLNEVSTEKLGGSALQTRVDQHTKAGNFQGNTGVDQLSAANTTEQRFRAIVALVDQAMQKGERLAALDLAGTLLGPMIAENLRKDAEYLTRMQASADKLAATEVVSAADVGRALELQARYDSAVKILETRWHPIQDLLTAAGVKMQAAWVGIVESVATAVDWVTKLVMKIGEIPQTFWDYIKKGANIAATGVATVAPAIPIIGPIGGAAARMVANATADTPAAATDAYSVALVKLRAGLQNTNAVQQQANEATTVANKVYGDASKTLDSKVTPAVIAQKDALARATDAVEKYILTTQAAAKSVGAGVAEQEKAKVIAQLTAAAMRDGKTNLDQYAAAWEKIGDRAGEAAQKLALAGATDRVDFQRQTLFMSPGEQNIAATMKDIYGPEWQSHMDDALAKQMRMNDLLKSGGDLVRSSATSFATDFVGNLRQGQSVMDSLGHAAQNLSTQLTNSAITNLFSGNIPGAIASSVGAVIAGDIGGGQRKQKPANDNTEEKNHDRDHDRAAAAA